ncbi:FAD-dependent thymidylate synthase [Laspinema sp. A4]|uniref:FAD-dependent thymidylate synthase n=1 Tax=Laspinema sp. D2d TaxID=2953686 RepID=UPI0021BBB219|nr:FAD-dependent thymidylate synthase [Laspinema sp. D2d]MCT7986074.1 FAD-dependent thymidylate synthase [Laspinema sp. D2d]
MDRFRVEVITKTPNPQQVIYAAMHQDYSEDFVYDDQDTWPSESKCGELIVKRLLAGERGHYGPIEHVGIVFNCGFFPHSVMQQIRTHRVGISFDVQCLAGDTEVTFLHAGGSLRKIKIAELYDLWANGEKAIRQRLKRGRNGEPPGEYRRDCKTRLKKIRLRVLNETTGFFEIGHINNVIIKGVQPVYRVTLKDGKTLDCTTKHRLFTSEGWRTMGEAVGLVTDKDGKVLRFTKDCSLMCNGTVVGEGLYRDKSWLQHRLSEGLYVNEIAQMAGCSIESVKKWVYFHGLSVNKRPKGTKNPWNKGKKGYRLNLSVESFEKRRENAKLYTKRGEDSHFWKGGTSNERELIGAWTRQIAPQVHKKFCYICQSCGQTGGVLHAHHLVPVYADESLAYDFDNLVTVCKACHEEIHSKNQEAEFAKNYQPILEPKNWKGKPKPPGNKLRAHPVNVVSVDFLGYQTTYDLEVEGPWHNFVANGVVVHNSNRYTGNRIVDAAKGIRDIEDVFYLRPVGYYTDRQGKRYEYTQQQRDRDLAWCLDAAKRYQVLIEEGTSEEHARGIIPFDVRQHWVVSFNARSLMHLLDLRAKPDAQLECQKLCDLIWPHFQEWVPAIAEWYEKHRLKKGRLSP